MSDEKQTSVDETKVESTTSTAADGATGDDLDTLLKEYEGGTSQKPPETAVVQEPDIKQVAQEIQQFRKEQAANEYQKDIASFVKTVRGDLDSEMFDDTMMEAYVDAYARKNPAFIKAWSERKTNPQKFEKIGKALNKEFAKRFENLPDRKVTEDTEAFAAAVRGAKTTTPTPEKTYDNKSLNKMGDRDFRKLENELIYGR